MALILDPLEPHTSIEPLVLNRSFSTIWVQDYLFGLQTPYLEMLDIDSDQDQDILWYGNLEISENRSQTPSIPQFGASSRQTMINPIHVLSANIDGTPPYEAIISGGQHARVYGFATDSFTRLIGSTNAFMSAVARIHDDTSSAIVVDSNTHQIRIFPFDSAGNIGSRIDYTHPDQSARFRTIGVADFDADGHDDVLTFDYENAIMHILHGIAGPSLEAWRSISGFEGMRVVKPAIIDFNNDGYPDIVVGDRNKDKIHLYKNNGQPSSTLPKALIARRHTGSSPQMSMLMASMISSA